MDLGGFGEGATDYFRMEREASNEKTIEYLEAENRNLRHKINRQEIIIKELRKEIKTLKNGEIRCG